MILRARTAILSSVSDFYFEVARGSISHHSAINKFGRNPDIDEAAAGSLGRDIWDGGIASAAGWVPPTAACLHAIAGGATDALDDVGAHTLRIFGLDAAYALQQEDLSMHATDGTTPVNTIKLYTMIHRMYVLTAGVAGKNVGDITATAASGGTVTAKITANNSQTTMAIFQIPADTTGYVCLTYASLHKVGVAVTAILADTALMIKEFGGVWRLQDSFEVGSDSQPSQVFPYPMPLMLPEKSYVKMVANPSADSQDISAGFATVLVTN